MIPPRFVQSGTPGSTLSDFYTNNTASPFSRVPHSQGQVLRGSPIHRQPPTFPNTPSTFNWQNTAMPRAPSCPIMHKRASSAAPIIQTIGKLATESCGNRTKYSAIPSGYSRNASPI
eukprot:Filipodium_phascolosomae@DN4292_c0_g1_i1.p1